MFPIPCLAPPFSVDWLPIQCDIIQEDEGGAGAAVKWDR